MSAAVTDSGHVYTWGGGSYGKLGQNDKMNSLTPRQVKGVPAAAHFAQVSCGTFLHASPSHLHFILPLHTS